jgi:hypothetical protein
MKNPIIFFTAIFVATTAFIACDKEQQEKGTGKEVITITITGSSFAMAGKGKVTIDWGDKTSKERFKLTTDVLEYSHNYTSGKEHTVVIIGSVTDFSGINITNLDVRQNSILKYLYCSGDFTHLDVSKCTALTYLKSGSNKLSNLKLNSSLQFLECIANNLAKLDASTCFELTYLNCNHNNFSTSALDALFGTLHSNTIADKKEKSIWIYGNPGTNYCNRQIAEKKGWAVFP